MYTSISLLVCIRICRFAIQINLFNESIGIDPFNCKKSVLQFTSFLQFFLLIYCSFS